MPILPTLGDHPEPGLPKPATTPSSPEAPSCKERTVEQLHLSYTELITTFPILAMDCTSLEEMRSQVDSHNRALRDQLRLGETDLSAFDAPPVSLRTWPQCASPSEVQAPVCAL